MDGSLAAVALVGIVAAFALTLFVRGIISFIREDKESESSEQTKRIVAEPKTVASPAKKPDAVVPAKGPEVVAAAEATASAAADKPAKESDWTPVQVQGPSSEKEARIAEIQQIVAKYV